MLHDISAIYSDDSKSVIEIIGAALIKKYETLNL